QKVGGHFDLVSQSVRSHLPDPKAPVVARDNETPAVGSNRQARNSWWSSPAGLDHFRIAGIGRPFTPPSDLALADIPDGHLVVPSRSGGQEPAVRRKRYASW